MEIKQNSYMQWAAVRTQQDVRRIPPHMWWKLKSDLLGLDCTETCQGWAPGKDLLPPKILLVRVGLDIPHWENWPEPGTGVATGGGAVARRGEDKNTLSIQFIFILGICVCVLMWETFRALLDFAVAPCQFALFFNETPRLLIPIWIP